MPLELENPLWTFALAFYRAPGVAAACLLLQDTADVDVIHLLMLLYADLALDRPLAAEDIAAAPAGMPVWRDMAVLPIRQLRRALKPPRQGLPEREKQVLRTAIKKAELLAEQIELAMAAVWLDDRPAAAGLPLDEALSLLTHGIDRDNRDVRAALHCVATAARRLLARHDS